MSTTLVWLFVRHDCFLRFSLFDISALIFYFSVLFDVFYWFFAFYVVYQNVSVKISIDKCSDGSFLIPTMDIYAWDRWPGRV